VFIELRQNTNLTADPYPQARTEMVLLAGNYAVDSVWSCGCNR